MATLSFTTSFDLSNSPKIFVFDDTSDYAGQGIATADVNGCFKIVAPSGITVYNNTDFDDADCDIRVSVSTENQTTIQIPLATNGFPELGIYTITYTVYDSNEDEYYTDINTYTYEYVRPEIDILQTVDCLSPLFTSKDNTDYEVEGVDPTIDRTHTVYFPVGSGASPEEGSTQTITLGNGQFYNGTQSTEITSVLTYTFGDGLIIIDEITGVDEINVNCTDTCGIYCCIKVLESQMMGFATRDTVMYEKTKSLFSQVMGIVGLVQQAIRCGQSDDVSGFLTTIYSLTNCTSNCSCSDSTPSPVTGIGSLINEVIVDSGDSTVIVTPVTVGNTTTYTVTINETFVNTVNNLYSTIVAAGDNITVTPSGTNPKTYTIDGKDAVVTSDDSSITVTASAPVNGVITYDLSVPGASTVWNEGSGTSAIETGSISADASGDFSIAGGYSAVASGTSSIALGFESTAQGLTSVAIGTSSSATGSGSTAVGNNAAATANTATAVGTASTASGADSIAIGDSCDSTGTGSIAIGGVSFARINYTIQVNGSSITRKFDVSGNVIRDYSANQITITSEEVDLKTVADAIITFPTGSIFYLDNADLVLTTLGGTVVTQPTVRLGISGTPALYYAAAITTNLTASLFNREKFTLISSAATAKGTTTLNYGVTSGAAGSSTIKGRFVFKGYLIEAQ